MNKPVRVIPTRQMPATSRHHTTVKLDESGLSKRLYHAALLLAQMRMGVSLDDALAQVRLTLKTTPEITAAIHDFGYTATRWQGTADFMLAKLCTKSPKEPIYSLLTLALTLLYLQRYPVHTLVDQAVQAAESLHASAKGLVNGVLRNYLRQTETLKSALKTNSVAHFNHPAWWIRKLQKDYAKDWQNILLAAQEHPPLVVRVNLQHLTPVAYLERLTQVGLQGEQVGPTAVLVTPPVPVQQLPGFADGEVSVQDAGAQLAAYLLDVQPGQRVLDACAAPGGKTGHILELAECDLWALEVAAPRLARVEENLQRLGLSATLKLGDATQPVSWWDGLPFERILADVPCSASGIVRRHPEIRWRRRNSDLLTLQRQQLQMLSALWSVLTVNGKLLYATCSVFPEEGEQLVQRFLTTAPSAQRLPLQLPVALATQALPAQLLPGVALVVDGKPLVRQHDGFFYALLLKTS